MKANKFLIALFFLLFVTPFILQIDQWLQWTRHSAERPRPTVASLTAQLKELPFAERIRTTKAFDRDASVGVMATFYSEASPSEVVDVFKKALTKSGWAIQREKRDPRLSLILCRNGVAVTIEPSTTPKETKTHVGVSWTYHTKGANYCPVAPVSARSSSSLKDEASL